MDTMTPRNDATSGMTGDRPGAMDDLSQNVDSARQAFGEATDRVANTARETVDRVADRATQTVDRVSGAASEYASQFSDTGERLLEDARDYIAAHPLRTLGMAAAAGFVIGRMLR
jgi:ElaB/YqjD/DUF883 family membrane-anchored ribosome-binding protein